MEVSHRRSASVKKAVNRRSLTALNKPFLPSTTERKIKMFMQNQDSSQILDISYSIPKAKLITPNYEQNEASTRLIYLRKGLDKSKQTFSNRDQLLSVMNRELDNLSDFRTKRLDLLEFSEKKSEKIHEQIEQTKKFQNEECRNRMTYLHLIDRMRLTNVHFEKKALSMKAILHSQSSVLNLETNRNQKSRENKLQSKHALSSFQKNLHYESQGRFTIFANLEKDFKQKELNDIKKEENKRRQEEFLEKAAIDDQVSNSSQLREKLLMHKMWFNLMTFQFQKQHET